MIRIAPVLHRSWLAWGAALLGAAGPAAAADYYVAAAGNDAADGLTPATAWQSIAKINRTRFQPGDWIRFKRGDAWREGQALYGSSNGSAGHPIGFGAYGEGAKPLILGSKDVSAADYWVRSSGNIWKTAVIINLLTPDGRPKRTPDVANLIFNREESVGVKKRHPADLKEQGDFCLNLADTRLYLYSTAAPARFYRSIEATGIRNSENNIDVIRGHYLTFTDLDIRYSKNNGLYLQDCSHVAIRRCAFSYIGGCYYPIQTFMLKPTPSPVRMGNGVQLWRGNSDVTVEDCTFDQIYDAAISPQGGDARIAAPDYSIRNLRFHHNVINRCEMAFELWGHQANSTGDGIFFEHNTCMNAGLGWSAGQRPDQGHANFLSFGASKMHFSDVWIRNNIFDEAADFCSIGRGPGDGLGADAVWAGIGIDYNCYYKSSPDKPVIKWRGGPAQGGGDFFMGDLAAYRKKSGKEAHSLFADPKLAPDHTLTADSPAIDAGAAAGYPYSGKAPDMGAFESGPARHPLPW